VESRINDFFLGEGDGEDMPTRKASKKNNEAEGKRKKLEKKSNSKNTEGRD